MYDAWYLAEAGKFVGPLSIEELRHNLHRFKDWKERLVWHSSFNEWRKAGAMRHLALRADLLWDDEARGLCLRVYGDGSKSFVFVYCVDGRQRFIRIGKSPEWSLERARIRAQELRAIVDQGHDPLQNECCKRSEAPPVEGITRYVAELAWTIQRLRHRAVELNQPAAKPVNEGDVRLAAPNVVKRIFGRRRSAKMR